MAAALDCVIDANAALNADSNSLWGKINGVVPGDCLRKPDKYNCGFYAIFNTLALVQDQEPSLQPVTLGCAKPHGRYDSGIQ